MTLHDSPFRYVDSRWLFLVHTAKRGLAADRLAERVSKGLLEYCWDHELPSDFLVYPARWDLLLMVGGRRAIPRRPVTRGRTRPR